MNEGKPANYVTAKLSGGRSLVTQDDLDRA